MINRDLSRYLSGFRINIKVVYKQQQQQRQLNCLPKVLNVSLSFMDLELDLDLMC